MKMEDNRNNRARKLLLRKVKLNKIKKKKKKSKSQVKKNLKMKVIKRAVAHKKLKVKTSPLVQMKQMLKQPQVKMKQVLKQTLQSQTIKKNNKKRFLNNLRKIQLQWLKIKILQLIKQLKMTL
jgi:hypothetical protein